MPASDAALRPVRGWFARRAWWLHRKILDESICHPDADKQWTLFVLASVVGLIALILEVPVSDGDILRGLQSDGGQEVGLADYRRELTAELGDLPPAAFDAEGGFQERD